VKDELNKAKAYAYRLLNYRSRSEKELRGRLKDKGYNAQVIDKLAEELKDEDLIDDKKFARLWAKMRSQGNARGLSVIKFELLSKGVDKDIVEETLSEAREAFSEEEIVRQLLNRRMRAVAGLDRQKARQRIYGYLKRRGFSTQVVLKVLDETYRDSR